MARKKRIIQRALLFQNDDPAPPSRLEFHLPVEEIPSEFQQIFDRFSASSSCSNVDESSQDPQISSPFPLQESSSFNGEADPERSVSLSKKKLKKASRMTIPQLKAIAPRPEVVEFEDVTAPDPIFLVHLKSLPNTVPVPGHWSQKRKFLTGKRGFVKRPYALPAYIRDTGVVEQRSALKLREESMSMGAKARDKINPRLGKLDLDYEKLYNAFFKWQTKPELTQFGDIYYEGKEFEVRLRDKKPGILSEELKSALGMGPLDPPPFLFNMQRFGPPPSYPYLRIAGVTAPIPQGCQWGFHPGGWGKPLIDDFQGHPLFGGIEGQQEGAEVLNGDENPFYPNELQRQRWGILLPEEEPFLPPPPPPEEEEKEKIEDYTLSQDAPVLVDKAQEEAARKVEPDYEIVKTVREKPPIKKEMKIPTKVKEEAVTEEEEKFKF